MPITGSQLKTRLTAMTAMKSVVPLYLLPMIAADHNDTELQALVSTKLGGITIFPHEYYAGGYDLPGDGVDWGIYLQPQQFIDTPITSATIDAGYRTIYSHLQKLWRDVEVASGANPPKYVWMDFEADTLPLLAKLQKQLLEVIYGFWPTILQSWYGAGQVNSVHVPTFIGDFQGIVSYYPDAMVTTDAIFKAAADNVVALTSGAATPIGGYVSLDYSNNTGQFGNDWDDHLLVTLGNRFGKKLNPSAVDAAGAVNTVPSNARHYDRIGALFLYDHEEPPHASAWHCDLKEERILVPLEMFVRGVVLGL